MASLFVMRFRSFAPTEAPAQVLVAAKRSVAPTESPQQMAIMGLFECARFPGDADWNRQGAKNAKNFGRGQPCDPRAAHVLVTREGRIVAACVSPSKPPVLLALAGPRFGIDDRATDDKTRWEGVASARVRA